MARDPKDPALLHRGKDFMELWNRCRGPLPEMQHLRNGRRTRIQRALRAERRIVRWEWAIRRFASVPDIVDKPWGNADTVLSPGFFDLIESNRTAELWRLDKLTMTSGLKKLRKRGVPKPKPNPVDNWTPYIGDGAASIPAADVPLWLPVTAREGCLVVVVPPGQADRAAATLAPLAGKAGFTAVEVREVA